ncbi:hypothetical protein LOAG_09374 [Loa loa]|uniref:Uncharacterized protein n=1 Tax=Loa loa TaxID=7209 RepID=A0A1S0TSJ3_LOALO|nr:hypothetical protein LOAG_09374 [Loa loa]EFO19120.1 hypothetical protein LOAG_09374 [Loa loa]
MTTTYYTSLFFLSDHTPLKVNYDNTYLSFTIINSQKQTCRNPMNMDSKVWKKMTVAYDVFRKVKQICPTDHFMIYEPFSIAPQFVSFQLRSFLMFHLIAYPCKARSAYIQMISEKERYGFGCFARTITAKQQPGSKPKLFYSLESSHPTNTHQKSAHHLVSKSPQLSIGKLIK